MFYTRSLKFFWQRTKRLQAHQILSLYTLSTLILYTVYDLKDFYATPDWWSSVWSSASCFLLPPGALRSAQSTTPSVLTPPIWENQNISSEVFFAALETWEWEVELTTNRRKQLVPLCVCFSGSDKFGYDVTPADISMFQHTLEFKLSNFQNRGCVATSYNETLRNKSKEKVWRQWIELIMLLVTEGTFNVLYLINIIPWRDLASVTINRHTRLDLIVVGSMKRVFSTACVIFHSFCELSWESGAGSRFFVLSEKIKTIAEKNTWAGFDPYLVHHFVSNNLGGLFHIDPRGMILTDTAFHLHTQINQHHMHRD